MKEVVVYPDLRTELRESAIPKPDASQLVIKVIVSGTNPKDWKAPRWMKPSIVQGDDIAGIVHAVGPGVTEFRPGNRVAAFHEVGAPGGSFAEYAVALEHATFHIPDKTSFEEAATLPLAFITSAFGLYLDLRLPPPWAPADTRTPLIVYGGSSATGAFAIKLAQLSNIHPIIAVAGAGAPYVESLIDRSKGDTIVDYRKGDEAVTAGILDAVARAGCETVDYAFDATTASNSWWNIARALSPTGRITFLLGGWRDKGLPDTMKLSLTFAGLVHRSSAQSSEEGAKAASPLGARELGLAWYRLLSLGLREGWMTAHPHEVVEGGLDGVGTALGYLRDGKASAVKYVLRIGETRGIKP